jgi:hypothetical protein
MDLVTLIEEILLEKKNRAWVASEAEVHKSLGSLGHPQCAGGGCGHEADAVVKGVPISVGHGSSFASKDVGQGTLSIQGKGKKRKWVHTSTSKALTRFAGQRKYHSASISGPSGKLKRLRKRAGSLTDLLHARYGTKHKARPEKPVKSGREKKHIKDDATQAIHARGETHIPLDPTILGAHHAEHHGTLYHVQTVEDKKSGKMQQHLFRTTRGRGSNPLGIFDKRGKAPPVFGEGARVYMRIRAKDSTRNKKTGYYTRRAVTAVKAEGNLKTSPSTIDLSRPHQTMHSRSKIWSSKTDVALAKVHDVKAKAKRKTRITKTKKAITRVKNKRKK